jgi:hypothetical protein
MSKTMNHRPMAAKSAAEMKKGLITMAFSVFVATLPSILLGLIAASTVAIVWPYGKGLNMCVHTFRTILT